MLLLRNFSSADTDALKMHLYRDMPSPQIAALINEWNTKQFDGRYFEMFAAQVDGTAVGFVSLAEKSRRVVSLGIEIFAPFRRRGYGRAALALGLEQAKVRGYSLVVDQVRQDNAASVALHRALGFDTDGYLYRNRHDNPIFVFITAL